MKIYRLPDELRKELSTCPGEIKKEIRRVGKLCIAVGDFVVKEMISSGALPDIGIVDYKTRRGKVEWKYEGFDLLLKVKNPAGTITKDLISTIDVAIKSTTKGWKVLIEIDGEEDLASIPAIILAPLDTTIIYGLPDIGACYIKVDENIKEKAKKVIEIMERGEEDGTDSE